MTYTIRDNEGNVVFSIESNNDFKNVESDVKMVISDLKRTLEKIHKEIDIDVSKNSNGYDILVSYWLKENTNYSEAYDKQYNVSLKLQKGIESYFKKSKQFKITDIDGNGSYTELYISIERK